LAPERPQNRRGAELRSGDRFPSSAKFIARRIFSDGEIAGALELKGSVLTVGPNGKAKSNVKAREVVILGEVKGDIDASHKITIRKQGSLVGNIKTMGIVIDDEAYFKGSIDIVRKPAETATA